MVTLSMAEARSHLAQVLDTVQNEAVVIERRGQRAAVVISPEMYDRMVEALEDADDVHLYDEAVAEGGDPVPWEQVLTDLGWK